jgi:DNA-binding CsgD family transcriptional regulator
MAKKEVPKSMKISSKKIKVPKKLQKLPRGKALTLEEKCRNLEEANEALNRLVKHKDEQKSEIEERILTNVKELILPYIDKIKKTTLDGIQMVYVEILEKHIQEIVSPFIVKLTSKYLKFTPKEIQVATLIKDGKTTKQIAKIMGVSKGAIDIHRNHIRSKLGLNNQKVNLRSFLSSLP